MNTQAPASAGAGLSGRQGLTGNLNSSLPQSCRLRQNSRSRNLITEQTFVERLLCAVGAVKAKPLGVQG